MPNPSPNPFPPSSTALAELNQHLTLLQSLHRRNKNQHRRSHWYKHLDHFRRQLAHLLRELSPAPAPASEPLASPSLQRPPSATDAESLKSHLASAERRRRQHEAALQRARARLEVWRAVFVRRWYAAFSRLVADRRFAPVGLVLLAAVAGVGGCLGLLEGEGEGEGRERGDGDDGQRLGEGELEGQREGEDVGVRVERDGLGRGGEVEARSGEENEAAAAAAAAAAARPEKKKRKGKRGDAIEDLFSGLV